MRFHAKTYFYIALLNCETIINFLLDRIFVLMKNIFNQTKLVSLENTK